jgi:hypothetical protein
MEVWSASFPSRFTPREKNSGIRRISWVDPRGGTVQSAVQSSFFFVGWDWVHLVLWPFGLLYQTQMIRWLLWSDRWNENWKEKPKYSEKTCPSATLSTTNPTLPDPGSNPGRRSGKPATNRLSYGTAFSPIIVRAELSRVARSKEVQTGKVRKLFLSAPQLHWFFVFLFLAILWTYCWELASFLECWCSGRLFFYYKCASLSRYLNNLSSIYVQFLHIPAKDGYKNTSIRTASMN